jgi:MazG family protein
MSAGESFARLVEIVRQLRDPESGCPWDIKQTHDSIRPYLLEEAYEVLEAIDAGHDEEFAKELGDLLLQVVLHAQIASDRKAFHVKDVVEAISKKLVRRHPHVFGDVKADTPEEVKKNWEQIKLEEKVTSESGEERTRKSVLEGIPRSMPSLGRAFRISEKAAHVGFDWDSFGSVQAKLEEELAELEVELLAARASLIERPLEAGALAAPLRGKIEHEIGDVLFSVVQLARWLGLSPEDCLRMGCDRFERRFSTLELSASDSLSKLSLRELESLWERAKQADLEGSEL